MNFNISRRRILEFATVGPLALARPAWGAGRSINEFGFVQIGGIDQWLAIQGRHADNPVILFLHGGPAEAQSPFLKEFIPWEKDFTVANWDQRGSGKTYGKNGPSTPGMSTPEMALDRMAADVTEIAQYLQRRLSKKKIILVGHSWGAMLGLHVVKRRPDLFFAFVGTGQPVAWKISLEHQEQWTRQQATAAQDQAGLKALDETAALPVSDMRRIMAANKYRWSPSDLEYLKIQKAFVGSPPFPTQGDIADWIAGGAFTMPRLVPIVFPFDARALGLEIPVPFLVVQGREDHVTPFDAAQKYVAEVTAPAKAFVSIAGGHFACFTNPEEFVVALTRHVRPLAAGDE